MNTLKNSLAIAVFSALASRLCCIVPFVAIISGVTGGATIFSFLEPFRPFLILISVSILAFGFYQEYKQKKFDELKPCCRANAEKKSKRNRLLLWTMTFVSMVLFLFPFYSGNFIKANTAANIENCKTIELKIGGMSCQGCANNIMLGLSKVEGIVQDTVTFETKKAKIIFDENKISEQIVIKEKC